MMREEWKLCLEETGEKAVQRGEGKVRDECGHLRDTSRAPCSQEELV